MAEEKDEVLNEAKLCPTSDYAVTEPFFEDLIKKQKRGGPEENMKKILVDLRSSSFWTARSMTKLYVAMNCQQRTKTVPRLPWFMYTGFFHERVCRHEIAREELNACIKNLYRSSHAFDGGPEGLKKAREKIPETMPPNFSMGQWEKYLDDDGAMFNGMLVPALTDSISVFILPRVFIAALANKKVEGMEEKRGAGVVLTLTDRGKDVRWHFLKSTRIPIVAKAIMKKAKIANKPPFPPTPEV